MILISEMVASSPGPSQILSRSRGEKAWDQNYVTDWKWWTWLVQTESTISRGLGTRLVKWHIWQPWGGK